MARGSGGGRDGGGGEDSNGDSVSDIGGGGISKGAISLSESIVACSSFISVLN